jgi:DNA-binding transcriptional LysR family regulator
MLGENQVKCFLSLCDTLSFTETAQQLHITRQAVSKTIAALERELGTLLFARGRRHVELTEAGAAWRDYFLREAERYRAAKADILNRFGGEAFQIRVGFQNYMRFGRVPNRAFSRISARSPKLHMTVERHSPAGLMHGLREGRLQIVLLCSRFYPNPEGMHRLALFRVPLVLLVSRQHPLAREGATCRDFVREPYLLDAFEGERPIDRERRLRTDLDCCGLNPSRVIVVPNRDSAYTAAELGQGVLISTALSRFIGTGSLVAYETGASDTLVCLWREDEKNPAVAEYARYLREGYAEGPAGEGISDLFSRQ